MKLPKRALLAIAVGTIVCHPVALMACSYHDGMGYRGFGPWQNMAMVSHTSPAATIAAAPGKSGGTEAAASSDASAGPTASQAAPPSTKKGVLAWPVVRKGGAGPDPHSSR